jgi:D-tagatose-1,6-bisphosphate aldolase subunit GatZ/KbaZ
MKPDDFRVFVHEIARRVGTPFERIWLGGDTWVRMRWRRERRRVAMDRAQELVAQFVAAASASCISTARWRVRTIASPLPESTSRNAPRCFVTRPSVPGYVSGPHRST